MDFVFQIQVRDEDQRNDGLNLTVVSIEPSTDPPVFVFQHHMLLAVGELDRESVPEYRVTIRVTDSVTESSKFTHSEEKVITIKVLDVNDNPAIFPNFQSPVYIAEGTVFLIIGLSNSGCVFIYVIEKLRINWGKSRI